MLLKQAIGIALISFSTISYGVDQERVCTEVKKGKDRGWLFYEEPSVVCHDIEKEEVKPTPKTPEPVKKEVKKPEPTPESKQASTPSTPQEPAFSTKWIRENIDKYADLAADNPTEENVRAYYALMKIAQQRAEKFALTAKKVVLSDPLLDAESQRPVSSFGINSFNEAAEKERTKILAEIKKKSGIFFFYHSECPYCQRQAQIMAAMKREGYSILPISLDGKPIAGFDEFKVDQGQSQKLGIVNVPALYVVTPGSKKEFYPIQQGGILAKEGIEKRLTVASLVNDTITEKQYYAALGIRKNDKADVTQKLTSGELKTEGFIDPKVINKIIRMEE